MFSTSQVTLKRSRRKYNLYLQCLNVLPARPLLSLRSSMPAWILALTAVDDKCIDSTDMTRLLQYCFGKTGFLLAILGLFGGSAPLLAGDAIVFGSQKTKIEPGKDKTPTQNPFRL